MNALTNITTGFGTALQNATANKTAPVVDTDKSFEDVKKAVKDFEAFFISQMFQAMYDTVPVNETFGGGYGEKVFRSMLTDEYGKMAAQTGGIGVSDAIMKQLVAMQAVQS